LGRLADIDIFPVHFLHGLRFLHDKFGDDVGGTKTAPIEGEQWPGSVPEGADKLEVFAPGSGHSNTVQMRRCRDCGTLYRYRYPSEYDVSGSWDDYFFRKLSDAAQQNIGLIL
jgi:hypothetical protein